MASTSTFQFHDGDGTAPCVDDLMLPVDNGDDTTSFEDDESCDTTSCEDDEESMMPVDNEEEHIDGNVASCDMMDVTEDDALWLPDLPIRNILSRVPPSSATRFKVVCKRWHSMITNARNHRAPVRSVLLCDGDAATVVDEEAGAARLALHPWRGIPRHGFTVQNCCGALACLRRGRRDAELLNPATGETLGLGHFFRHGPPSTWTLADRFPWYCLARCAAGTGEYKVVRLDIRVMPVCGRSVVTCEVLSLGRESWDDDSSGSFAPEWKKVDAIGVNYSPADRGVHVAGVVYYLAWCVSGAVILVSFDLGTHVFDLVGLPAAATEGLGGAVASLSELEGRLCLSLVVRTGSAMDIYILGDDMDGGGRAWFQVGRIDDVAERRVPRPLLRRGGRTLMKRADGSLCYYDCDMDGGGRGKGTAAAGEEEVVYEHQGSRRQKQQLSGVTADVFLESPLSIQAILRGG